MKVVDIIIASQEYKVANHKELWKEIGEISKAEQTIVLNISGDLVVSLLKRKTFRVRESIMFKKNEKSKFRVERVMFLCRPEISNKLINKINRKMLKYQLIKLGVDLKRTKIRILHYGGIWTELIENIGNNIEEYYYIMDEVRLDAHSDEENSERAYYDKKACERSKYIFVMSEEIKKNRSEYKTKIKVIGNGAKKINNKDKVCKIEKSVGLIGNIRNWIDEELLEQLINKKSDINFGIIGNVESDMKGYIEKLSKKSNVKYYGKFKKEEVNYWYRKFDVIIVPYKNNKFMRATRPIKIVESIFAGTPVVTIPISGYEECEFIKFAESVQEFSDAIDKFILDEVNIKSEEYIKFIHQNSWEFKAKEIINEM